MFLNPDLNKLWQSFLQKDEVSYIKGHWKDIEHPLALACEVGSYEVLVSKRRQTKSKYFPIHLVIRCGRMDFLKRAVNEGYVDLKDPTILGAAIVEASKKFIRYILRHGGTITTQICVIAAKLGNLSILKKGFKKGGCLGDAEICTAAYNSHHYKVFKWLVKHECPYDKDSFLNSAISYNSTTVLKFMLKHTKWRPSEQDMVSASLHSSLKTIKILAPFMMDNTWSGELMSRVSRNRDAKIGLAILQWIQQTYQVEVPQDVYEIAIERNHFKTLKWAYRCKKCKFANKRLCQRAISHKNLKMLKWLCKKKCPDDKSELLLYARVMDDVKILQFVQSQQTN